jgi:metal-responsive CopG/Arc/MetJ family transcriptional regulator
MAIKVMVSLPEEFLVEIDRVAQEEHRSRSELLREAMRLYIDFRRGRQKPGDRPRVQKAVEYQNYLSSRSPGSGEDSTVDIRKWRHARG